MTNENRPIVIAGNWKMNKTIQEAVLFIKELIPLVKDSSAKVLLAVPFTALTACLNAAYKTNVIIGAQNVSDEEDGAYTGEISAKLLKDAGAQFVIIGHSERRRLYNETDWIVNKKLKRALHANLIPIICVGESLNERQSGRTELIVSQQLLQSLAGITTQQLQYIIIAYEPVWAIGTNVPATPQIAEQALSFCRNVIANKWGKDVANKIVIQYGGSVNEENAKIMLEQPNIDGLLIGTASLKCGTFSKIVISQNAKVRI